jgi:hypothetical protein
MLPPTYSVASSPLPLISLACSALAWLVVLIVYQGHAEAATLTLDVVGLLLALAALLFEFLGLAFERRGVLSWVALGVSLAFPVWLWQVLSHLPSDAL